MLREQEAEVLAKKQELTDLRSEEIRMEQQMQANTLQLEKLQTTLQETQLQISQIKGWKINYEDFLDIHKRLNGL